MIASHAWWHFSNESFAIVLVAFVTAGGAYLNGRRNKRVEGKVDRLHETTNTGNDKNLGTTVHDLAQTTEIISAQLHTNTKESIEAASKADTAATHARTAADLDVRVEAATARIEAKLEATDEKLERHLNDSAVLVTRIFADLEELKQRGGEA